MSAERFAAAWELLPDFGRIQHLPHKPNTDRDDLVATPEEAAVIFGQHANSNCLVAVEEKIDGSQVAIAYVGDDEPAIIRNKNHVLVKGYGRKNTPAKAQYAPLWNWAYEHADSFKALEQRFGQAVSVYGEWIFAEHTLRYDLAPADFIAYEIYLPAAKTFAPTWQANLLLEESGFHAPETLLLGPTSYEQLEALTLEKSRWSSRDLREGVMVKVFNTERQLHRFKMRRADFKPREDFNDTPLRRRRGTR